MWKKSFNSRHYCCRTTRNPRAEKQQHLCSDLVKVRWVDRDGVRREEIVVLEAYSVSGASLLTGVPVGEGVQVTLYGREAEFRATVRHCVLCPNGYLVGVDLMDRPLNYVPEHLLDLSRLIYSEDS